MSEGIFLVKVVNLSESEMGVCGIPYFTIIFLSLWIIV